MNSEALKINIAQRILSLNDERVLAKIARLLDKENVVGFEMDGNPITEKDFVADIDAALNLLSEGPQEVYDKSFEQKILKSDKNDKRIRIETKNLWDSI